MAWWLWLLLSFGTALAKLGRRGPMGPRFCSRARSLSDAFLSIDRRVLASVGLRCVFGLRDGPAVLR